MSGHRARIDEASLSMIFLSRDRQTPPGSDYKLVTLGIVSPGFTLVPGGQLYEPTTCLRYCFILSNVLTKIGHI